MDICCNEIESEVRRGPWTIEEDNLLIQYVSLNGEGRWNSIAKCSGLRRTGKSCRLRWLNYLKPDIKRGNLSPHEQLLILELHSKLGNRWSKIARHLPGRTDNEIKNYWRTRVQKQARQLHLDSNSHKFLEAVRTFWKPRLLEKMEQDSPHTSETQKFESPPSEQDSTFTPETEKLQSTELLPNICQPGMSSACLNSSNLVDNSGSLEMIIEQPDELSSNLTTENFHFDQSFSVEDLCCNNEGMPSYSNGIEELGSRDLVNVAGGDWLGQDTFWDTDDLWQLRQH